MWKKSISQSDPLQISFFSQIKKDIHCHLLPGIDDGSPDVATSVDLIRQLLNAGFQEFICTPHIIGDLYRNTPETIHQALLKLKSALQAEGMNVRISAAAEYMLDDYFLELIGSGNRLLTLSENYLLTELPYTIPPGNLEELTFEINTQNYQPVLAHPERYAYYHRTPKIYARLKDLGFLLQINLLSLTGWYGKPVRLAAEYLLKNELVDLVGTDLHHYEHLEALINPRSQKIFKEKLGDRIFNDF